MGRKGAWGNPTKCKQPRGVVSSRPSWFWSLQPGSGSPGSGTLGEGHVRLSTTQQASGSWE